MLSLSASHNDGTFAERFHQRVSLTLQPSGIRIVAEQTDGEQCDGEDMQSAVWDGAIQMASAMQDPLLFADGHWRRKQHVIELGAGCGVVGIAAALLGCQRVTLTDYPQLLPLLRRNATANHLDASVCDAAPLEWGSSVGSLAACDAVLGSDVTTFIQSHEALCETLCALEAVSTAAGMASPLEILIAHQQRGSDVGFFLDAFEPHFEVSAIWCSPAVDAQHDAQDPDAPSLARPRALPNRTMIIFSLRRRPSAEAAEDGEDEGEPSDAAIQAALRGDIGLLKATLRGL